LKGHSKNLHNYQEWLTTSKDLAIPVIAAAAGAAVGSVVTVASTPLLRKLRQAYRRQHFDPKEAHYRELVEQAKWFEDRATRLAALQIQLPHNPTPGRFQLAGLIARLDRKDAEWARQVDETELSEAAKNKETECLDNATECAHYADDVNRKVFW
jgi:hypothetical protein